MLLKVVGVVASSFCPAWFVTQYQLRALVQNQVVHHSYNADLLTMAGVERSGASLLSVLTMLSEPANVAFFIGFVLCRCLVALRINHAAIRLISALLCGSVALVTLVMSVIGFYRYMTLGGVVAGTACALLFGSAIVPLFLFSDPRSVRR